jgi:RimJ/RimL family protein N-acetyltransferase/dTDP-4-dehydrorhamnose 3,5-epimerase-like enzyme
MKISLRSLKLTDSPLMLEWQHDPNLAQFFRRDFTRTTKKQVADFIARSHDDPAQCHYAIVNEDDEYLGTISLKNINQQDHNAEYAVALRQKAIGQGVARVATTQLLQLAFGKLKLHKVFLTVLADNQRARRFYEKMGFVFEGEAQEQVCLNSRYHHLAYYGLTKATWQAPPQPAWPAFKLLEFPELGDERGQLVVAETGTQIPFVIQRVFYIFGSDAKVVRGLHANRRSQFVLINVQGNSKVKIDLGKGQPTVVELAKPHQGVYLNKMVWKEMYDFSPNSILLCLASENYDPQEYIRDYQQFVKEVSS